MSKERIDSIKRIAIFLLIYLVFALPILSVFLHTNFKGINRSLFEYLNIFKMWQISTNESRVITFVLLLLPILALLIGEKNKEEIEKTGQYGTAKFINKNKLEKNDDFVIYDIDRIDRKEYIKYTDEEGNLKRDMGAGEILYYDIVKHIALMDSSGDHSLTIASTGDGKDRRRVNQLLKTIIDHGECAIINDPKKEQFRMFAEYAKEKGYNVYCLDFRNNDYNSHWNPLTEVINLVNECKIDEAQMTTNLIASSLEPGEGTTEDNKIWLDGRRAVISALSLSVCLQKDIPEDKKNLNTVYSTLSEKGEIKIDSNGNEICELNNWFLSKERSEIEKITYAPARLAMDRTKMSFFVNIATSMSVFALNKVADQTSKSDFDLRDLADINKKPTMIFVVYPYETDTMDKIVNLFYDTAFRVLTQESMKFKNNYIPRRIHMVMNEFSNLPKQTEFTKKLTVGRGSNIRYYLYVQSEANLSQIYGDKVKDVILNNCKVKVYISASSYQEAKSISDTMGNETIQVMSKTVSNEGLLGTSYNKSKTYSLTNRLLMTPDEIMSEMKKGYAIVIKSKTRPYKAYLSDISEFKYIKYLENKQLTFEDETNQYKRKIVKYESFVLGHKYLNTKIKQKNSKNSAKLLNTN